MKRGWKGFGRPLEYGNDKKLEGIQFIHSLVIIFSASIIAFALLWVVLHASKSFGDTRIEMETRTRLNISYPIKRFEGDVVNWTTLRSVVCLMNSSIQQLQVRGFSEYSLNIYFRTFLTLSQSVTKPFKTQCTCVFIIQVLNLLGDPRLLVLERRFLRFVGY